MKTKYIFVTGGVVSGLGKGITAASLGRLLKNRGYKVANQKCDPYLNVDPGNMNPCEHGEVFITDDGAETDLDLGHYERFTDESLTRNSSVTTGKIYQEVIEKERRGEYLGKTVQVVPHITNAIKEKVCKFENSDIDIVITEIGGTVGDIESLPFLEAIRQIGLEKDQDTLYIHVTLLPYIYGSNELKSKPTQHSVKELQSIGIKPDILVCRAEQEIDEGMKNKLALFCNVKKEDVIQNCTVQNLYEVPLMLEKEGLADRVCQKLQLKNKPKNEKWEKMIENVKNLKDEGVKIAIVGKYIKLEDSYLSIVESIKHGGFANNCKVEIDFVNSEEITKENVEEKLSKYSGIIIPSSSENKKIDGEIATIEYARKNKVPFLGIGLGMHLTILEFIKNVLKHKEDYTTICNKNENIRLGAYKIKTLPNTLSRKIYNEKEVSERHRSEYEYNNKYKEELEEKGLICSGIEKENDFVEIVELKENPYFIAVQYYSEFKSRPDKPHPLYIEFMKAAKDKEKSKSKEN